MSPNLFYNLFVPYLFKKFLPFIVLRVRRGKKTIVPRGPRQRTNVP